MSDYTNERGNQVSTGFDMGDRYRYDFKVCTRAKGWAQYDTQQDASYFGVWVHVADRKILTFCEGDVSLVTCATEETYKAELASMAKFYGDPPPAFTVIDDAGITKVYDERPA